MTGIAPRTPFAQLRTNQLGKLGKFFPTTYARPRWTANHCAQTSCERFSQLPPPHPAGLRSATHKPVVNGKSFHNFPNLNFVSPFNLLLRISSCGGETTPYGGRRRAPAATPGASSFFHRSGVSARVFIDRRSNP